jgi:hypothetical protein
MVAKNPPMQRIIVGKRALKLLVKKAIDIIINPIINIITGYKILN